jgi:hypothetical protein
MMIMYLGPALRGEVGSKAVHWPRTRVEYCSMLESKCSWALDGFLCISLNHDWPGLRHWI